MSEWNVQVDTREVLGRLNGVVSGLKNRRKPHERCVIALQGWTLVNWPGGPPLAPLTVAARRMNTSTPLLDRGDLRLSLGGRGAGITTAAGTLNSASDEQAVFGTNLIYASLQNFGGTVMARNVKYLPIPMSYEAKRAGSPRAFGKPLALLPLKNEDGWIMVEGEEVTITRGPNKGGTRIVPRVRRGKGQAVAHYLLKRSVTIPPRKFFPTEAEALGVCVPVVEGYLGELAAGKVVG